MLYQFRKTDGSRDPHSSGSFVRPGSPASTIPTDGFRLEPVAWWQSEKSSARYPVAWKLSIPSREMELIVRARFNGQELNGEPFT